jgi:dihydrodipicolinate synthase/N-acetylneuraminate lyase
MHSEELKVKIRNVHAYVTTPFKRDDVTQLALAGLEKNLEFLIANGVKVLSIGGGTGEVNALSNAELATLARTSIEIAGDAALVIPTFPENLRNAVELAPVYEEMGAQVVLGMAPYIRNEVPDDLEGVYNHYRILGENTSLPFMPYNTQVWTAEFFRRLADIDGIIGVKDPCRVPHNLFAAIQHLGDRFVWIGNKRHYPGVLHLRFQMGIEGFTAGLINFNPADELRLFELGVRKEWDEMVGIQAKLAPLEGLRTKHGDTAMLKTGLDLVGLYGGPVRPPRVDVSPDGIEEIREAMEEVGIQIEK